MSRRPVADVLVGRHPFSFAGQEKLLVVAEAPAPSWSGEARHLCATPAFLRWASRLLGVPVNLRTYLSLFDRCNVAASIDQPVREDSERLSWLLRKHEHRHVVLVGRRAMQAAGLHYCDEVDFLSRVEVADLVARDQASIGQHGRMDRVFWTSPHPSGKSTWWNLRQNRRDFASFGRALRGVALSSRTLEAIGALRVPTRSS